MKTGLLKSLVLCIGFLTLRASGTTYYVDINSPDPTPPYTNWSTAATDIQNAIAETVNGDSILVNPGVYQSAGYTAPDGALSAVDVTNAITIQGVDGEAETSITGSNVMRCIYLANGATLTGFTLTDGNAPNGAGVYCASTNGTVISNCVIIANAASNQGGGAYQGTFFNCTVIENHSQSGGGGFANAAIFNSLIVSNETYGFSDEYGGGAYNCSIFSSAIEHNLAFSEGGGAYGGTLVNCTITANTALQAGGGTTSCSETNCIIYFNTIYSDQPDETNSFSDQLNYCCTTPNPGGNSVITSQPVLADISHISLNSPCRGAGEPTTADTSDIDGNPWNSPPSIGCSEIPSGGDYGNLTVNIAAPFTNWAVGYPLPLQTANSGPDYNTVWNFGDGTTITNTPYISHIWSTPGTYPVTLTAYNDTYPAGITATQMITITVPSVFYVNLNSSDPTPPYMTWATAAMTIQDAVNVAPPGSLVLVTNGPTLPTYQNNYITNSAAFYMGGGATAPDGNFYRVMITNAITVESVNGPATTYIWGPSPNPSGNPYANCVYLANGATLSGFTITNYSGPSLTQITAASTNAVFTNCIITHDVNVNSGTLNDCSILSGSGANNGALNNCSIIGSSGAVNCLLNNCVLSNNCQALGGVLNYCLLVNNTNSSTEGGAATASQGYPLVLNNCILSNNVSQSSQGGGYGGGVYNAFHSTANYYTNCILNNCILAKNSAQYQGGGAYGAELNNCLISGNNAQTGGGIEGGLLNNCTLSGNSNNAADGTYLTGTVLTNCTLVANVNGAANKCSLFGCALLQNVGRLGGGAYQCALNNCLIMSNTTTTVTGSGGGVYGCDLTNCILVDNISTNGGGAYQSTLVNCTVAANTSTRPGGGILSCSAANCIIYYDNNGDFYANSSPLNYCCVPPPAPSGLRNITNAPLFVNLAAGDYHLQSLSPCINSGNNAYVQTTTDLDGNPRSVGGTVDIGAYEYQTPVSETSYAWLQRYGLGITNGIDAADLDGTAFNIYQDWIAGLNPTNPASILAMLTPVTTNTATGITVTWQSVSGIPYFLQRSTNLVAQPRFLTIQNNITGQTGTTSYTDTSATNNIPYFYRVGVVAP
jgi:hypothetical protein